MVPLQLLVTAILNAMKLLLVNTKITSYKAETVIHYILLVVGILMLQCSTAILKALFLHTSTYIVTIPKELYKTHVKKHQFFCK